MRNKAIIENIESVLELFKGGDGDKTMGHFYLKKYDRNHPETVAEINKLIERIIPPKTKTGKFLIGYIVLINGEAWLGGQKNIYATKASPKAAYTRSLRYKLYEGNKVPHIIEVYKIFGNDAKAYVKFLYDQGIMKTVGVYFKMETGELSML